MNYATAIRYAVGGATFVELHADRFFNAVYATAKIVFAPLFYSSKVNLLQISHWFSP